MNAGSAGSNYLLPINNNRYTTKKFDINNDGKNEFVKYTHLSKGKPDEIIKQYDFDSDGNIDYAKVTDTVKKKIFGLFPISKERTREFFADQANEEAKYFMREQADALEAGELFYS